MTLLESVRREGDGRVWLHVSLNRLDRDPFWLELAAVKRQFVGDDREAYVVLAPASRHVNLMPHCLHLWAALDGEGVAPGDGAVLPDFSQGTGSI